MSLDGWIDKFTNAEIKRTVDKNGIVSYKEILKYKTQNYIDDKPIIQTSTNVLGIKELFIKTLKSSNNKLTDSLKQIIDDMIPNDINSIFGSTRYTAKTPLGYAIDDMHVMAVDYLLKKGANPNICGTNQKHILQELLNSNATDKRVFILKLILPHLNSGTIKIEKNYNDQIYTLKYLIPLVESTQLTNDDLIQIFNILKPKERKIIVAESNKMLNVAMNNNGEEYIPDLLKNLFLF